MFGFFQFQKDLKVCKQAVSDLMAPSLMLAQLSGKPFPNQIFADAYIVGFIQTFLIFVMHARRGKSIEPQEQMALVEATFNYFIPEHSGNLMKLLPDLNRPEHPSFENYSTGKQEAGEYVAALEAHDQVAVEKSLELLTDFIKRNYLKL